MRPLLLALALLAGGCATLGPSVTYLGEVRYPPTAYVERLRAEPARPYTAIAELAYISSTLTRREIEDLMAEQARALGADAVVLGKSTLAEQRSADDTQLHEETYRFSAVAIRYRDR